MEKGRSPPCAFMGSDNTTMKACFASKGLWPLPPDPALMPPPRARSLRHPGRRVRVLALGRRLCALLGGPTSPQLPGRTLQSLFLVD